MLTDIPSQTLVSTVVVECGRIVRFKVITESQPLAETVVSMNVPVVLYKLPNILTEIPSQTLVSTVVAECGKIVRFKVTMESQPFDETVVSMNVPVVLYRLPNMLTETPSQTLVSTVVET